ncbi:FAD-dependent oxidoreductase [Desulfotalea psychrophila]|uniref:Related to xylene monooxygenase electron transfer component n=1 Tax=Desulfotalea psychrophila (strain LSv54 / DSM 12343) TaxID=177439 RepID=Q6AQ83_DESPS|nr:FAD-dependent oxidoreductase [Desulfotalea psychrophila]CAG35490.1 related to xylene monooxygenase electron transfer component [Desulfotalea psychrophila LSv54]
MEYCTEFLERIKRTPSSISYRFKMPEGFSFVAGQYMLVDLGDELARPLSLSSCPQEGGFIEFTKRMIGSPYCMRLESLQRGEAIRVAGPFGEFCCPDSGEPLVLIAGGIGITPIRSILTSLKEERGETTLIYGNQNREDIAFRDELEHLSLAHYHLVHVLSDATGMENAYQGFINADILAREVPKGSIGQYMVSGPPLMVEAIKKGLAGIGVAEERIRTDIFLGY